MKIKDTSEIINNNKELLEKLLLLKADIQYMINYIEEDYIQEDFAFFANEIEKIIENTKETDENFYDNYMKYYKLFNDVDFRFKKYLYEQR